MISYVPFSTPQKSKNGLKLRLDIINFSTEKTFGQLLNPHDIKVNVSIDILFKFEDHRSISYVPLKELNFIGIASKMALLTLAPKILENWPAS